jgi:hypothetical protein
MIVPDDITGSDILCLLFPSRFELASEKEASELLHRICYASLRDFDKPDNINTIRLTEDELKVVLHNRWCETSNLEVKARCNDVMSRHEKDKREKKIIASETYLIAFKRHADIEFLIRSITVRDFKAINTDEFLKDVLTTIHEYFDHPFWILEIIGALRKSYTIEDLKDLSKYIESEKNKSKENKDHRSEREYVKGQYLLEAISKHEYHKEMALSFENEAEETLNNKEENTFYLNLVGVFQEAYNEIFEIKKEEPILYTRLKDKLRKEKNNFMQMLSLGGVKNRITVPDDFKRNVDASIATIEINSLLDTLRLMIDTPFISKEEVEAYESSVKSASITQLMFGHSQLDGKGNTVGSTEPNEALRTEAHVYFRLRRFYIIQRYLYFHRWSKIKSEESEIYFLLEKSKPEFVNKDNIIIWAKGIHAGLNGDFITASFVLTPILENALLNMAEIKDGDITTLEKKRQLSPTLGSILPRLDTLFEDEVYFEISSFLQGEIDVNFRNNLLHGLFTHFEIERYAPYLWWLSIKIYFQSEMKTQKVNKSLVTHKL